MEDLLPFLYHFEQELQLRKKNCLDMGPASFKNTEMEIHPLNSSDDKMSTFTLIHRTFRNRNLISF